MGESANKRRSEIDVAEFERRLRPPAASGTYEDPLAELARLVDSKNASGDDPFSELFAAPRQATARHAPAAPPLGRQHAFFADLRGSIHDEHAGDLPPDVIPSHAPPVAAPEHAPEDEYGDPAAWAEQESDAAYAEPEANPRRSRRPLYAVGAIVCAGLVGIGASFAMRSKAPGSQEVALVKAPAGPVKVAPENPGGIDVPNQSASVLDRAAGPQVAKVVSREERPVDLNQQVKQMRVITLGGSKDGTVSTAQGAASVPVPPPPAASVSTSNNGFPEPKRVKTVAVRPDGSLLVADASPARAADPIAAIAAGRPAPSPAAASGDALPKSGTPKMSARVASTPAADSAANDAVATTPASAKPKTAAAKPKPDSVKVASAEDSTDTTPAQTAASSGAYAVQLAAPTSEPEARSVSSKLNQKFASVLDGHRPSIVKAEIGEKSIYRVRVGSLSRDEANSLCGKIKSKGGECFVAKN
ncbi:MAG: SPOR domain-containing protein [Methylobacteriaceae bacterium]|nr:SPOR domain-containing protein [Methylobacteriaceae bacterium]